MNTLVDVLLVVFLLAGIYAGMRKGLIKSLVSLIGLVAIVIISFSLKTPIANFLIDNVPFFNYAGAEGLTALNILVFNALAFVVVFVVLYAVLNVILSVTGFIDTLLKFTVIWIIPSKIGGAIIGFLETWVFLFLLCLVLSSFNVTAPWMLESKVSDVILNHTPIIGNILGNVSNAAKDIYGVIEEFKDDENKSKESLNQDILLLEYKYNLITVDKIRDLIDTGKIEFSYDFQIGEIKK